MLVTALPAFSRLQLLLTGVLKCREMHKLVAGNARTPGLNEPGRREAGSALQAY